MHHAAPWDNTFDTQNIDVNQIDSTGNVDIGLMNLLAEMAMPAMDLTHDDFHTQNIDVNQIDSAGNVDIGLMNLLAKVDPKHVEIKSMVDWCYKNDSAKAKKICPHHAAMKAAGKKVAVVAPEMAMPALDLTHDVFHTQNIDVNQIDSAKNVVISLQNLCDGSDCNQMFNFMI
jgi:hypothetical protein